MAGYRIDRISEDIKRELISLMRELKDPRVSGKMLTVVNVKVSNDLSYAKVYVSILEDEKADGMMKALKNAAGFIRHELGLRCQLRYTPELIFVRDQNIAYGAHIAQVLSEIDTGENHDDETHS